MQKHDCSPSARESTNPVTIYHPFRIQSNHTTRKIVPKLVIYFTDLFANKNYMNDLGFIISINIQLREQSLDTQQKRRLTAIDIN